MKHILRYSKGLIYLYCLAYSIILFELIISLCYLILGRDTCDIVIDKITIKLAKLYRFIYRALHGTRVIIDTSTQIPLNQSHLILSSHKGASDFFVLSLLLSKPPRFIAKQELRKLIPIINIPTISKTLTIQNHALINRANAIDSLKKIQYFCKLQTYRGNNMLLFPEGTRYKAILTKSFFLPAIKIILRTKKVPIALVALSNGHKVNSFFNVSPNITLRAKVIGIYTIENLNELEYNIKKFRNIIDIQLAQWEKEDEDTVKFT